MGRAKARTHGIAVAKFNGVLGASRGSLTAQAQRDSDEERVLEAVRAEEVHARETVFSLFLDQVQREDANALDLAGRLVDRLRRGVTNGRLREQILSSLVDDDENEVDKEEEIEDADEEEFRERELEREHEHARERKRAFECCESILAVGEPKTCPGLIKPVEEAVCEYFLGGYLEPELLYSQATKIVGDFFWKNQTIENYQRLQPLSEAVGALLERPDEGDKYSLVAAVGEALVSAPKEAVAGPLRSWAQAINRRFAQGLLGEAERDRYLRNADTQTLI
jgi:chemotaxis protein histidine kinase CheA